jgi:hypothetical protein
MGRRVEALAVGLLVVGIAAFLMWPQPSRATWENFDRIRKGMSRAEVEAILGPEGDYRTGPQQCLPSLKQTVGESATVSDWFADDAFFSIGFDESGGVVMTLVDPTSRTEQGPLDNLRWRLKRQWHRWFP